MNPTLLVLAAGMGSRYGGLKQIEPFGPAGETITDYSIYGALAAGIGKVVFVIRRAFEREFRAAVGGRYERRIPVEYVFQDLDDLPRGFTVPTGRTKPWGTAHAIWCARRAIAEPFVSINADDFYGKQSFRVVVEHLRRPRLAGAVAEYAMPGYRLLQTLREGSPEARAVGELDEDGFLRVLVERRNVVRSGGGVSHRDEAGRTHALAADALVSMNIWGFTPDLFGALERLLTTFLEGRPDAGAECLIPTAVDELVRGGVAKVRVLPTSDVWFGVTHPEDRPAVTQTIRALVDRGEYPSPIWGQSE